MLGTIKLYIHLGHTRVALKFIVCDTLTASTIIGAGFCDQHVKEIKPKQKLVELESGDCIPIVLLEAPRANKSASATFR